MAELVEFGSLYVDGRLKVPDVSYLYEGGKITIEDTSPGRALSWFRAAGLLWADRNIVCKISWEQLRELNLLYGVPVKIDGGTYILRCPKGGSSTIDTDSSEWDMAMVELGADTMFMNWANQFSWSQEQVVGPDMSSAVVRGFHGKQYWAYYDVSKREEEIGFRPVLELIKEEIVDPVDNLGRDIKIWGLQCDALEGELLAADEYDLVLKTSSPLPQNCSWAIPSAGNNVIVNRSGLVLMAAK